MSGVTAVILGGGRGTRLFPLTKDRAKPSVPVAGKFRLIDIPMSNCLHSGLDRIFILTQFNSTSLNNHIAETYLAGGLDTRTIRVLAAQQTRQSDQWFQGTADAVRQTLDHLLTERSHPEHILVLSADHLYRMDYRRMIAAHLEARADITVAVTPVGASEAPGFGILKVGSRRRVERFVEKPQTEAELVGLDAHGPALGAPVYFASMGVYLFRTGVLVEALQNSEHVDFGRDIFPASIDTRAVHTHAFAGYWADIGTIRAFYEANLALLDRVPRFDFYDEEHFIYTSRHYLPSTKVNASQITQSMLAEGSIIDESVIARSIVGLRCRVGQDTRIENSLLMGADYYQSVEQIDHDAAHGVPRMGVGQRTTIANAIVDKNTHIGDDVAIVNLHGLQHADGDNYHIRDGIVVIPRGAVVPSGTVI